VRRNGRSTPSKRSSDKARVGTLVEELTGTLKEAGALATAGESLLSPLKTLASWVGPAGLAAIRLLS
jgi:hypothetical protein